jgi:uncharacterized heparinase superfamily protein
LTALARLIRTVAPLRPVQIYGRLWFRIHKPSLRSGPPPPPRLGGGSWAPPIEREPTLLSPLTAHFLGKPGAVVWNDPRQDKLWLYNLHYFDELSAPPTTERRVWRRDLVTRWIAENPPGNGNGWEPYPLSLRIVNWIKWALAGEPMQPTWIASLADQTRWLAQRLEYHLLGNHLVANAKALAFAGFYFTGPEADRWRRIGLDILAREVPEQVLADGGHFERSPMYHAIILEDLLDLTNLHRAYGASTPDWPIDQMRRWLAVMTHPDNGLSFFNDAAFGIAPTREALENYSLRLGLTPVASPLSGLTKLPASGYFRAARNDAVLITDAAPIGPTYLPGHAHADTLSFELSIREERLIVNGGVSTYAPGPERSAERATAAHSTVEIDGENSSEVWGSFRVGRAARPFDVRCRDAGAEITISAAHDGYRWRPGRPVHRREWKLSERSVTIVDMIEGVTKSATARFHLCSGVGSRGDGLTGVLFMRSGREITWRSSAPTKVRPSNWRPRFGVVEPSLVMETEVGDRLETRFAW